MKKYRLYKVEPAPTPTFPNMVSVTSKGGSVKKFVSEEKAVLWIEEQLALKAINSGEKQAKEDLMELGLVPFEFKTA